MVAAALAFVNDQGSLLQQDEAVLALVSLYRELNEETWFYVVDGADGRCPVLMYDDGH